MKTLRDIITTDDIYMDARQVDMPEPPNGFQIAQLPCADWGWRQDDKLIVIEEKKSLDLEDSLRKRRLQRQIRSMMDQADIIYLGLRTHGGMPRSSQEFAFPVASYSRRGGIRNASPTTVMLELAKFTNVGGIVFIPETKVYPYMLELRKALAVQSTNLSILAGTDRKRADDKTPFAKGLRRLFTGLGEMTAAKLEDNFRERGVRSIMDALTCHSALWREAGAHRGIIKQLEEYQT